MSLTMSPCSDDQFTCSDGECVKMAKRCDSRTDCRDGSDEEDCRKVVMEKGYSRVISPASEDSGNVRVDMTIIIDDILSIDEMKEQFIVKMTMVREWFDYRLTFLNLKEGFSHLNIMTSEEAKTIWYPSVNINNIEHYKKFRGTSIPSVTEIIPNNKFQFLLGGVSEEKNVQLFRGSENKMKVTKQWSVTYICHYNTLLYPFDTQTCRLEYLEDRPSMLLNPLQIGFNSNISLNRYFVRSIMMCHSTIVNQQAIFVEIQLGRPLVSSILTVFIPTTILTTISFMVRRLQNEFQDMVVEVNLTVLLVQATL